MDITIYHNPRCSKSRQTLAIVRDAGIEPTIIDYLEHPPDAATLQSLLTKLDLRPSDIVRRKEPEYAAMDLDDASDEALLEAMSEHPILIERPIVVAGDRAVIGRPPESVKSLLA